MKLKTAWAFVVIILIMASSVSAKPPSNNKYEVFAFGLVDVQKTSLEKFIKRLGGIIESQGFKFTVDDKKQGEVAFMLDKPMSSDAAMTYTLDTVRDVLRKSGDGKKAGGSTVLIVIKPIYVLKTGK